MSSLPPTLTSARGRLPQCWGHRGASAAFPENTLASFEGAIRDGVQGIESDIHVSLDQELVMCHDPDLVRTTGSRGLIRERNWHGPDGIEHLLTIKEPRQRLPLFSETLALINKPGNKHIILNIDVKVWNNPNQLFSLMHKVISAQPNWETELAPRIVLGLWHPTFLAPAARHLPLVKRSHIGLSPFIAREYFWDFVDSFSMNFGALCTSEGNRFRGEAQAAGKKVMVWTVNSPEHMMECVRWKVDAIITDVTATWVQLQKGLSEDYDKAAAPYEGPRARMFLWTSPLLFTPMQILSWNWQKSHLEKAAGVMQKVELVEAAA